MLPLYDFHPVFYLPPSLLFVLLFQSALVHLIAVIELCGTASKFPDLELNNPDVPINRRTIVDYLGIFLSLLIASTVEETVTAISRGLFFIIDFVSSVDSFFIL
jgi:hypothetical protein